MNKSTIKVLYPHTSFDKVVTNEYQKFPVGARVYVRPIRGGGRSHFTSDVITTVEHTYDQAYGNNDKWCNKYSLEVAAWYYEDELMLLEDGETLQQARAKCLDYFGESYDELSKPDKDEQDWWAQVRKEYNAMMPHIIAKNVAELNLQRIAEGKEPYSKEEYDA